MSLRSFLGKQFIDVIQWTEEEDGVLAYRYPMQDMEIQNGAQLTVRESQMAAFVNEGRIADIFGPGLYTLNTRTLPLLTNLKNWTKEFQSPFKSDVFFFSTRIQIDQRWGTATPITIREKEFGAVRVRVYGIYSYRVTDPRAFFTNVSGTQEVYHVEDLEGNCATPSWRAWRRCWRRPTCLSSIWRRTRRNWRAGSRSSCARRLPRWASGSIRS